MTTIEFLKDKFDVSNFIFSNEKDSEVLTIPKEQIKPVLEHLKNEKKFNFLLDVCGVDYPKREKRFDVVYHLFSSETFQRLRIKTKVGESDSIDSVTSVFKGANWFEREAFDMFGIKFKNHPYLRRILTHHEFKGHPLRKDYVAHHQQSCDTILEADYPTPSTDEDKNFVPLNIGPSHPATHGTLRIMAELDGETINRANVEIGFLHRCFEKMAETHHYNQVIPYTDRLNYCSAPMNNVGFCKTVEKMLDVEVPPKAQAIRVMLCELSRVIDHIVCIGAMAVDLGALTSFFYLFDMRERVYSLFEKLCGARLTVSMTRVGGMANEPPIGWFNEVLKTVEKMKEGVNQIDVLLSKNKIWIQRTKGVGATSLEDAIAYGYTGPCLRASGLKLDLRKVEPYYCYDELDFEIPVGENGDVYDRYMVRLEEMKQSLSLVEQVANNVPSGDYTIRDKDIVLPEKKDVYGNIEGLMNHFMLVIKGLRPKAGEIYDYTEAANGELGFYLVSDGGPKPYRLKVRPPCFAIYQSFVPSIEKGLLSDVIAILGSMNVIAGELDR